MPCFMLCSSRMTHTHVAYRLPCYPSPAGRGPDDHAALPALLPGNGTLKPTEAHLCA